jgi:hypothetical protein
MLNGELLREVHISISAGTDARQRAGRDACPERGEADGTQP